jgi:hypothetical protein
MSESSISASVALEAPWYLVHLRYPVAMCLVYFSRFLVQSFVLLTSKLPPTSHPRVLMIKIRKTSQLKLFNLQTAGQMTRLALVLLIELELLLRSWSLYWNWRACSVVVAIAEIMVRVFPSPISSAIIPPKSSGDFSGRRRPVIACSQLVRLLVFSPLMIKEFILTTHNYGGRWTF